MVTGPNFEEEAESHLDVSQKIAILEAKLARWKAVAWKFSDWYGRFPGVSRDLARAATLEEYERALGIDNAEEVK
jgi:hypothetical protein